MLAFVAVALGALGLFAGLVFFAASRDVSDLTAQQQGETLSAVAHAAGVAFADAGSWKGADLDATITLAKDAGAQASVVDTGGRVVAGLTTFPHARLVRLARVQVGGARVGSVRLAFSSRSAAVRDLRDALIATILTGGGLAALLALAVSIPVARRITRPLQALISTTRAMESGDRGARVAEVSTRGELGELSVAFNRMAESVAAHDHLRRTLVADVAHELRTPLTVAQATLEGLIDGVTETTPARLSSVHDDVLRLTKLIEDLEMLAAADAAGPKLQVGQVDLAEIAQGVAARFAPHFETAELALSVQTRAAMVRGDHHRLDQVASNLVMNALKFTPPGGAVTLTVDREDGMARLEVADTGIGIPPEDQDHVFERFWRGATARNVAGSGVGLTVVHELARAHGGVVEVHSDPGCGTRVRVILPAS